jgi:hypothetical protein
MEREQVDVEEGKEEKESKWRKGKGWECTSRGVPYGNMRTTS